MQENTIKINFDDDSSIILDINKDLKKYAHSWFMNPVDEVTEMLHGYFYDKFQKYFGDKSLDTIYKMIQEKPLSYRWNITTIDWNWEEDEGTLDAEELIDGDWTKFWFYDLKTKRELIGDTDEDYKDLD